MEGQAQSATATLNAANGGHPGARHIKALDGYRGVGVAVVLLFHFGLLRGGWLGVELFFVLSGFLITRLLVMERAGSGRIDLVAFWRRRARRLLPAVVMLMAGVAVYSAWYPDKILLPPNLPRQMLAALFYVANWQDIFSGSNYWDQFAVESPLRHMWSLSIEEQFYVLFPLVMIGLFAAVRHRMKIAWILGVGAVASWSVGFALLATGHDFERVYLGTDTRIGAVLIGAFAGYRTCQPSARADLVRWANRIRPAALAVVGFLIIWLDGSAEWSPSRWLVMPLFEICVAVLLVAALRESDGSGNPIVTRLIASSVLVWLGTISYGLYLWHVPVILVAERSMASAPRAVVVVVAAAVSLAIAQASYALLERPLRVHGLRLAPRFTLVIATLVLLAGSLSLTVESTAVARAERDRGGDGEAVTQIAEAQPLDPGRTSTTENSSTGGESPSASVPPEDPAGQLAAELPLERPAGRNPRILLLGDSVAFDLNDAFLGESERLRYTASASSLVGCGLGGVRHDPSGDPRLSGEVAVRRCQKWTDNRSKLIEQAQPDVVLLMRVKSRDPESGQSMCSPEYLDWFRNELRSEIKTLGATGAVVVVPSIMYSRFVDQRDDHDDDLADCRNVAIRKTVESMPNAAYLPLSEWICPSRDDCIKSVDGVTLRPDGMHFKADGAVLATEWILDQIYGPK
ncbi:MAG TPA: acyltransferase [Microthrixaceae bacterium]|nr:acyltransferase [Microthrixaceae bacterium]